MKFREAKKILGNRESKKIQYATWLHNRGSHFAIRHHETDIIKIYPRKTVLDTDGWKSRTTKDRLNEYSPGSIWSVNGIWYASFKGKEVVYQDGLTFHVNGAVTGGESVSEAKRQIKLRNDVKKYSKAFVRELKNGDIPKPSEMDCFDCGMFDKGKAPNPADSHLLLHIKENYFIPSLVRNAVVAFPVSEVGKAFLYSIWNNAENPYQWAEEIALEQIEKSIRKFLFQKLGLVR